MKSASLQYANALADIAVAQAATAPVVEQLGDFVAAYLASPELRNVLASPAVSQEQKRSVVEKIASRLVASKPVRNFLFVVVDHQRTHLLPKMFEQFLGVLRERQGVAEAEVFSAVPLNDDQKKVMTQTSATARNEAKFSLDANLLGGALVRVGDTIYDGSLRNRLNGLRDV